MFDLEREHYDSIPSQWEINQERFSGEEITDDYFGEEAQTDYDQTVNVIRAAMYEQVNKFLTLYDPKYNYAASVLLEILKGLGEECTT
jgi:hypothetical protein